MFVLSKKYVYVVLASMVLFVLCRTPGSGCGRSWVPIPGTSSTVPFGVAWPHETCDQDILKDVSPTKKVQGIYDALARCPSICLCND